MKIQSKKQPKITDFFKPTEKQIKFRHRSRQTTILEFFGKAAIAKPKQGTAQQCRKLYYRNRYSLVYQFRRNLQKSNTLEIFIFSRNGYCYYCDDNYSEFAVFDTRTQKKIASATLDDNYALEHIMVDIQYRRQGIGCNLIRAMQRAISRGITIYTGNTVNSRYCLTTEGAALINYCTRKGIILDEQCLPDTPSSPSKFYC